MVLLYIYPYLKPYNCHKLQPRTTQCVFVGYAASYKGVLCYDRLQDKCIISRHVIHDENTYPFKLPECAKTQSQPILACTPPSSIPILVSLLPLIVEPTLSSSSSPSQHPNMPLDNVSSKLRASNFALQSSDHFWTSLASQLQVMSLLLGSSSDVDTGSQLVATAASPSSTTVSIPHNTHCCVRKSHNLVLRAEGMCVDT